MDAAAWEEMQKQMAATNAKLDAFAGILVQLKADVAAIRDSNFSSSNSDRRIPCPLECGADFKKVCELWGCCSLESRLIILTGELLAGPPVQIYQD
jgi:hypothetical protein